MLFLPLAAFAAQPSPAPAAQAFDLAGALARARAENPPLRAAKARVEERRGVTTSARADALPQLTVGGDFTRFREDATLAGGAALATPVAATTVYTAQAFLAQPLFRWGSLREAIHVASLGEGEAEAAHAAAELDTLHTVAKAYVAVLAARAELDVVQARLRTAEQFRAEIAARRAVQSATRLDELRAESEYLGVIPENLDAEARHRRSLEVLNGLLALDPGTPLELRDPGLPGEAVPGQGAERGEIVQLRRQEEMHRAQDRVLLGDARPRLDLNASFGYQANQTTNLFRTPYDTWKVNLTLRFPLFDGLRTAGKRAQNRAQLEQTTQARLDKERSIAVEQRSAEREWRKAQAYHEAAGLAAQAALEALRTSRELFGQGLITSLDLLQAERTERQQESLRQRAQLGLWTARFDVRRANGLPPI